MSVAHLCGGVAEAYVALGAAYGGLHGRVLCGVPAGGAGGVCSLRYHGQPVVPSALAPRVRVRPARLPRPGAQAIPPSAQLLL